MCLRPGIRSLWRLIVTSPICSWKGPCRPGKQDTIKAGLCKTLSLAFKQEKGRQAGAAQEGCQLGRGVLAFSHLSEPATLCRAETTSVYPSLKLKIMLDLSYPEQGHHKVADSKLCLNKEKSAWDWSQLWSWYIGTLSGHFPLTLSKSIWFMTHAKIRLNKNYLPDTTNMYNIIRDCKDLKKLWNLHFYTYSYFPKCFQIFARFYPYNFCLSCPRSVLILTLPCYIYFNIYMY